MSNKKWGLSFLLVPLSVVGAILLLAFLGMGERVFQVLLPAHLFVYSILMFAYHRKNAFNIKIAVGFSLAYVIGALPLSFFVFAFVIFGFAA